MLVLQHSGPVSSVAFSPFGENVLTNALDDGTFLWETATGKLRRRLAQAGNGTGFALYDPSGRAIFSPSYAFGESMLYDVEGDGQRRLWKATGTFAAMFSSDGTTILVGGEDGEQGIVQRLDSETGDVLQLFETHQEGVVDCVAYSSDESYVLASIDRNAIVWHRETGKRLHVLRTAGTIHCAVWSPDDTAVLAGCDEGIGVWNAATGDCDETIASSGPTYAIAFSPNGRVVLISHDRVCRLWKWPERALLHTFIGHSGPISSVAFSPDSKLMLTGSYDTTARLWQVPEGLSGAS